MKEFGIILVLYRPTAEFVANMLRLSGACPHAVAVDNSPDPDEHLHGLLRRHGVQVILNGNRGGLAGAYNRGADALLARGCEAFFLLDQDSEIERSFFEKMLAAANELGLDEFLLGPKIYEIKLDKFMPMLAPGKYLPKSVPVADKTSGLFPTMGVISSGSMISAAAYRKIGPFREDYFIEYLDGEYSMRARRAGVPIYLNAAVTLRQNFGDITRRGKLFSTNHPAWRRYYVARNCVHCFSTYREYVGLHWLSSIFVLQQVIMVLLFEAPKGKKLLALASGYVDGVRGRLGTFEERHPRLAAICGAPAKRRKLSHIEHIVEGNIVYFVRVNGCLAPEGLRSALNQVQKKHPALRALLREERNGLCYDYDAAPEIPLRIVPRETDEDYRCECERELRGNLGTGEPLFRATWLRGEQEHDLLLTTSHRICDGASMLILVREILECLREIAAPNRLIPYQPITPRDLIADYRPSSVWKSKLAAWGMNCVLRLPESRKPLENREHFLEWRADVFLSERLRQRSKQEGASVHAMFLVALDRALPAVFGGNTPKWIENPVDIRRGRFPALKDDMIFFGGGNFKVMTGRSPDEEFWDRARAIHEEIHAKVEQELREIPRRLHFLEMLRPVSRRQVQTIVRLGDVTKRNGSWNRFAFSNLGKVDLIEGDAPFQVTDLRIYMHSVHVRALCLVTYTFNGEMRFYCMGDEKCISPEQAETLRRRFMEILENAVAPADTYRNQIEHAAVN
ncbi:MAG: glycosyltransferase [Bryobacterales bacterium]|nr:glycosyltransferase [Bryobacterales bacterium]MBV9400108.1 glycosyltransferase [Bryobacterales bacterium]